MNPIRVHILCEGQTEEAFVRDLLKKHFEDKNITLSYSISRTSPKGKGGVVNYEKVKNQILKHCKKDTGVWFSTLFDFYGLPTNFPDHASIKNYSDPYDQVKHLEKAFQDDINQPRFMANLLLHEFEALLFSDTSKFLEWFEEKDVTALKHDVRRYQNPEQINHSKETAPSKRIMNHLKGYKKLTHGSLIAQDITLDVIRKKCPHFKQWITKLENLNKDTSNHHA